MTVLELNKMSEMLIKEGKSDLNVHVKYEYDGTNVFEKLPNKVNFDYVAIQSIYGDDDVNIQHVSKVQFSENNQVIVFDLDETNNLNRDC